MSRTYDFPMLGSASLSASRADINEVGDALLTNLIGSGDVTGALLVDGSIWIDTATTNVRARVSGSSLTLGKWAANLGMLRIDGTNAMTGSLDMDGQDIILTTDGNTKMENGTNNSVQFVINSVATILWGVAGGEFAWNETGADINFRIESDTNANLVFCDAGLDSGAGFVGIRTGTPNSVLQVNGSVAFAVRATSSTPDTLTAADHAVLVTAGAGTFTVNLPAIVAGRRYHIKVAATSGGVVEINRAGSDTIEDEGTGAAGTKITLTSVNSSITIYGGTETVWFIDSMKGTVGVA